MYCRSHNDYAANLNSFIKTTFDCFADGFSVNTSKTSAEQKMSTSYFFDWTQTEMFGWLPS